jgi:thiosulfate/3-mercaptopyruvate sulfurtransferase
MGGLKWRPLSWVTGLGLVLSCGGAKPVSAPAPAALNPVPSLIPPSRAAQLIAAGAVTVLDARPEWTDYLQNHLPGATWLGTETLRSSEDGLPFQLLPAESYATLFSRLGVRSGRPVLVYSAGESRDIDATFVTWILQSLGVPDLYLIDGGIARWSLEGRAMDRHYPAGLPGRFLPTGFRPEGAPLEEVRRASVTHDALLVDARSPQQYSGSAGAQLRRGHIPGAINHPWSSDLEKRDLVLVWKRTEDLRAGYESQGITGDRNVIVYCNTSTEASHVYFALRYLLGYPQVRIYLGSWSQWAENEDLPVEVGDK